MYVEHSGRMDGPVLMLLHGGGVAGWMWRPQVQQFSARFRLVVPDLPGHGRSSAEAFTTIRDTADELAGILAALRAEGAPVAVAGFSLGAQIAVELVGRNPGLVDSAVIVSALAVPLAAGAAAACAAGHLLPLARLRGFARLQARALHLGNELFEDYFRTTQAMSRRTLEAVLRENACFAPPEGWGSTGTRAAVVAGRNERAVMRRSARLLADAHPDAALHIVEGAGHGLPLQDPERFAAILERATAAA
ncbi:alpha/beta fold hydrolase [Arthrobacter mangrovi]|uniref:Alpha/beta hydrolase n=1 Tax=Arthrobacter mangrovi TaxID=2966350 RepID=A0ABQ5MSW0_9MICC|nr:alpha/beta hydrolase [Arthrobacter mangrovi]GLB67068.1 alpha/beta hydrolase [Arthrobacter mangrovi]